MRDLTQAQEDELKRLKQYFPYRIVWARLKAGSNEFSAHASFNRRRMNAAIKNGDKVFQLK